MEVGSGSSVGVPPRSTHRWANVSVCPATITHRSVTCAAGWKLPGAFSHGSRGGVGVELLVTAPTSAMTSTVGIIASAGGGVWRLFRMMASPHASGASLVGSPAPTPTFWQGSWRWGVIHFRIQSVLGEGRAAQMDGEGRGTPRRLRRVCERGRACCAAALTGWTASAKFDFKSSTCEIARNRDRYVSLQSDPVCNVTA